MQATFEPVAPVKVTRKPQFSIRTLLIATTLASIGICFVLFPPIAAIALAIVYGAFVTACIVAAISGRGWIRPFAIVTALYLIVATFVLISSHIPGPVAFLILMGLNLVIGCTLGICAAVIQGFFARRGGVVPIPNVPFLRDWLYNEPTD